MLLKVQEVAEKLRCSESFVYDAVREGRLVPTRLGKGQGLIRIAEENLNAFLASARERKDEPVKLRHITLR